MKAALLTAFNEPLEFEDVQPLDLGDHDVRLTIEASGVCHSDLSVMRGALPIPLPIIMGHEGAGTVLEVGSGVTRVKPGDRVIASIIPTCGNCWYCAHDMANHCEDLDRLVMKPKATRADGTRVPGMAALGTFAEEMIAEESLLVRVETDLPSEELALIGCGVTTGVGAVLNTAHVRPGTTVAVIGCGGVGQSVVQGARIAGAGRIFAIDPVELKRKTAEQLGATDPIDPRATDPVEAVRDATHGRGVDYAFEVVGRPEAMLQAFQMTRKAGTAVIVGMTRFDETITFPSLQLLGEEKRIVGSAYGSANIRRDFPLFVSLAESGRLDIGSMVSRRVGLDDLDEAFRSMEAGEVIRTVIT